MFISIFILFLFVGQGLGLIGVGITIIWFVVDSFFMIYMKPEFTWKDWFIVKRLSPYALVSSLIGCLFYIPTETLY